jgi:hypothetical protein
MNVRNLLELEGTFERDREVVLAPEKEEIIRRGASEQFS